MMSALLERLRVSLSEEDRRLVLRALREEPTVWKTLQAPDALSRLAGLPLVQRQDWAPGRLALLFLNPVSEASPRTPNAWLEADSLASRKALEALREVEKGRVPENLQEAGLAAAAIWLSAQRESWETALLRLNQITDLKRWQAVLACLPAWLDDPMPLLQKIAEVSGEKAGYYLAHILLSQPFQEHEQLNYLQPIIAKRPLEDQLLWLLEFHQRGRNELSRQLAQFLLLRQHDSPGMLVRSDDSPSFLLTDVVDRAAQLQRLALLSQLGGRTDIASTFFGQLSESLGQWRAYLLLHSPSIEESQADLANLNALVMGEGVRLDGLYEAIALSGDARRSWKSIVPLVNRETLRAVYEVIQVAETGESLPEQELDALAQNVRQWLQTLTPSRLRRLSSWRSPLDGGVLMDALHSLGLTDLAIELGHCLLSLYPTSCGLLERMCTLCSAAGLYRQALDYGMQWAMLADEPTPALRCVARIYEKLEDWERALAEWEILLTREPTARYEDRLAYVNCALRSGHLHDAMMECQRLLQENPNQGLAHAYYGAILAKTGDLEEAIQVLTQATLLAPEEPFSWLQLADLYRQQGDGHRELEILRSASMVLPNAAETHKALGKAYLERGSVSEATPSLRRAFNLNPQDYETVLLLAESLGILGHHEESLQVLESARKRWSGDGNLAYLEAKTRFAMGADPGNVRELLRPVLFSNGEIKPEWLMFYLHTLTGEDEEGLLRLDDLLSAEELDTARFVLQKVLAIQPDNLEARISWAFLLLAQGQAEAALEVFRALGNLDSISDMRLRALIYAGMGMSTLALGEHEAALAGLQSAAALQPNWIGLRMRLADAYLRLNLDDMAMGEAEKLLEEAPENLDVLEWFSEVAIQANRHEEAIRGLERAIALAPQRADLWLRLAAMLFESQRSRSREILENLLSWPYVPTDTLVAMAPWLDAHQEYVHAAQVLERAIEQGAQPKDEICLQIAVLHKLADDHDEAFVWLDQSLDLNPRLVVGRILRSQWLEQKGEILAAVAALEQALHQLETSEVVFSTSLSEFSRTLLRRYNVSEGLAEVHRSCGALKAKYGDLNGAYVHMIKSLESAPGNLDVRVRAAELALATLQFSTVLSLIPTHEATPEEDAETVAQMAALRAEAMLEGGDVDGALACVERGLAALPESPYLIALKIRCLARQGRLSTAQMLAQNSLAGLASHEGEWGDNYLEHGWLGDAWLAVLEWERGLKALQKNAEAHADIPLAQWRYARGIVQAMESHYWLSCLGCETHKPSSEWMDRHAKSDYEQAVRPLMSLTDNVLVQGLLARGRLIIETTPQNLRALVRLPMEGENVAAILSALARLENWAGVERVARQFLSEPWVDFHAAVFLKDKMPDFAQQLAQQAALALSEFAPAYMVLGLCAQAQGSYEVAMNAMEQAIHLWPDEWRWLEQAATLALRLEDEERAGGYLDMLLNYQPDNLAARLSAAWVQADLGKGELAFGHLEKALQLAPGDPDVVALYAQTLLRFARAAEASALAEVYLERFPGNKEIARLAARAALESHNWERADELTSQLLEDEPTDEQAIRLRVSYLEAQGLLSEALALLEGFLAESGKSESLGLAFEKARLVYHLKGAAEAIPLLEAILGRAPEDVLSLALAAQAYYAMQDLEKAEAMALKALQFNGDQGVLHALLGEIYTRAGQLDKALYHYGEVLRLNPQEIDAYLAMGRIYQRRRELPKAYAVYQQAIRVAPRDYRLYFEYGLALRDGKDYPAAEAMLRKAAQLAPENLQVRRQLGALVALNLVHQS